MAKSATTAQEFIQNAFSPTIAVLCSPSVESVCRKNNLSFVELIQPFCRMNTEVFLRDPQNQAFAVRNLRIVLKDMNWQCPSSQTAKSLLNYSVSNCFPALIEGHNAAMVNVYGNNVSSNGSTPWFEAYRECFLRILPPSSHEFIGQYVACILVASSEDPDPLEELRKLSQKQHENQHQSSSKTHRWFSPNTFKYHVLVHDLAEGNLERAQVLYGTMESTYGPQASHLLKINSKPLQPNIEPVPEADSSQMPDPWSQFMTAQLDESQYTSEGPLTASGSTQAEYDGKCSEEDPSVRHPLSEYLDDKEIETAEDVVRDEDLNASLTDESLSRPKVIEKTPLHGHGACLTVSDMDRLRIFVHEFCVRGLLPYVERQMRVLGEAVANRKGIPRSIFSATKKWFGGSKPTVPYTAAQANVVVYGPEALELQVRRLGDLAFMFQHHELAYQAYHMAKRDFTNDMAWLHCAGAQEMAAVAVFMLGNASTRQFPAHYLDSAILMYLNTCKSPQLATRCTLLSTECLKSLGRYAEAAGHFVRLTSEDSDLRSALLLEQAAHCYANLSTPHMRKFTFYLILAGHRYNKAGQRKHSLRTYKMAQQVFKGKGWHLAQDHVNLLTGRLNLNLGLISEATSAYRHLLYEGSKQSASQQAFFVREFINTLNMSEQTRETRPKLPLPMIAAQEIKVLLGVHPKDTDPDSHMTTASSCGFADEDDKESKWLKLEKTLMYDTLSRNLPYAFQTSAQLYTSKTDNSKKPAAFAGEPVAVLIVFKNPLEIPLLLNDVHLIWTFKSNFSDEEISNEQDEPTKEYQILTNSVAEVTILGGTIAKVALSLVPTVTGELHISGVAYKLGIQQLPNVDDGTVSVCGMQNLYVQGPKVVRRVSSPGGKAYDPDFRLNLNVFPPMPRLGVNFYGFPTSIMCGEVRELRIQLTNHSSITLSNLHVISTTPELFVLGPFEQEPLSGFVYTEITKGQLCNLQSPPVLDMTDIKLPTENRSLQPGESHNVSLWLRGPEESGPRMLNLLFYYEDSSDGSLIRHRVLRHESPLLVSGSVGFEAVPVRSADKDEGLVLTLDVTNCNDVLDNNMTTVSVIQVTGVSDTWKISQIVESSSLEGTAVGPKETVYFCIKAKQESISHKGESGSLYISNVPLGKTEWDVTRTPCMDFYRRSVQKISSLLTSSDEINSPMNITSTMNNDIGLGLIILWKAFVVDDKGESRTAYGQHHICFGALDTPVRSYLQPTAAPKLPLRFVQENPQAIQVGMIFPAEKLCNLVKASVRVPSRIHHDFNGNSVCVVDVQLNVENQHIMNVQIVVDAARVTDEARAGYVSIAGGSRTSPGSSFVWVGRSCTSLSTGPQETRTLSLRAAIFAPGVYNLSDIYVGARPSDHPHIEMTPQKGPGVRLVVVEDRCGVTVSG